MVTSGNASAYCIKCLKANEEASQSEWSRGMIPALGAGGPGFDSRFRPEYSFPRGHRAKIFIVQAV